MSTNFDVVLPRTKDCCEHCPRRPTGEQRLHLGKRWGSGGGRVSFTLRAYRSEDGHQEIISLGRDVASWADWKAVLDEPGVMVLSESGILYSPAEFIAEVEASKRDTASGRPTPSVNVIDEVDGFVLLTQEFC